MSPGSAGYSLGLLLSTLLAACGGPPASKPVPRVKSTVPGAVASFAPAASASLDTTTLDHAGRPLGIACATCHGTAVQPGLATKVTGAAAIHAGQAFKHGALTCRACHEEKNPGRLHLADGSSVGLREAPLLCAQCHGPQMRDYVRGAHGGMNGSWDLSRGARVRNACTSCHAAHAPAFPRVLPATATRDRGRGAHP